MDLQHPLRSLIPSLDWAVLEVLAATHTGLGMSQISRLSSKGSRKGQASVLDRLVNHGLVIVEPANHGYTYRFNRDHLLAPAVLLAAGIRAQLLQRIGEEAAELSPRPMHAAVFGSFARGEAGLDSDIDVLLIADDESGAASWDDMIDQLQQRVQLWTGNRCRCLVFTADRLQELVAAGEPIVSHWLEDGLVLIGDPLQSIVVLPARGGARRAPTRAVLNQSAR